MKPRYIAFALTLAVGITIQALSQTQFSPGPVKSGLFVFGEVQEPGWFPLDRATTLRKVVVLAHGTKQPAIECYAQIFREDTKSGEWQEIKADLSQIVRGKKEDILILPNDIVIVLRYH